MIHKYAFNVFALVYLQSGNRLVVIRIFLKENIFKFISFEIYSSSVKMATNVMQRAPRELHFRISVQNVLLTGQKMLKVIGLRMSAQDQWRS